MRVLTLHACDGCVCAAFSRHVHSAMYELCTFYIVQECAKRHRGSSEPKTIVTKNLIATEECNVVHLSRYDDLRKWNSLASSI